MEKKINQKINEIIVQKNVLNLLNKKVEKYVLNSNIIIFVDFLTLLLHKSLLDEIKTCGLNNAQIEVVSINDKIEKFESKINETYNFVVCIGENWLLKFGQNFAIKNNINYGFVNLFMLKTDIFASKTSNFAYFPPSFCLIEKISLNSEEKFSMLCDIFKYSFLALESEFDFENEDKKIFSNEFLKILNNIFNFQNEINDKNGKKNYKNLTKNTKFSVKNCQNFDEKNCECSNQNLNIKTFDEILYESVIKISLMLEKFNFSFTLCDGTNEFMKFSKNFVLAVFYKKMFQNLNEKNLWLSRIKFLNANMLENYENLDIKFFRFYLLNFKEKFYKSVDNFILLNGKLLNFLKENFFKQFYFHSNLLNENVYKINFEQTFLQKMSFFEIFNEFLSTDCLKI